MSNSFDKLKTATAQTKREGSVSGGLSGDLEVNIDSLDCLPIDPVTPELAQVAGLDVWVGLYQTMVDGDLDIVRGDQFISGDVTYKVRAIANWDWRPESDVVSVVVLERVA
jgi:hypothetical protein